jgi:acetaldehyde dehydrogenase (acetylating)
MDKDLASIQEARDVLRKAREAADQFRNFTQDQVDRIVQAMAERSLAAAKRLGEMACEETGYGRAEDKTTKNVFSSRNLLEHIKGLRTCGVVHHNETHKIIEIAVPMGIVAALVPCTNPTSTAIYKSMISLKSRNAIVMSPHPKALNSILETTRILHDAACSAGAPRNLVQCLSLPTLQGSQELMRNELTSVILATGGSPMVKAAYSAGKPAYGVGPGNVPAYVDRTADIAKAARDIVAGKSFDWGTVCASEQSVVADRPIAGKLLEELRRNGTYVCTKEEKAALQAVMVDRSGALNPDIVGQSPEKIAGMAGIKVPRGTRVLLVMLEEVGPKDPLSREKLSPVLGFYVEEGWKKGCDRAIQILSYGGVGHTFSIHCKDQDIIMEFGLHKPAFRIIVNSSATHGAIGYTTGLPPAMTLGPGTWGGSITTDNIGPLHLVNIKRVAFEINPLDPADTPTPESRWGYDKDFRYRPKDEAVEEPSNQPRRYEKSRMSDTDIERIVKEFKTD